ncbi:YodC family protein [Bradyrhizobium sp. McL0615]|uniref:YodC family protein n=1 Tax=Bradyrhizobium sp. McL0615 TaxID=3415673 RepID=UPI003CF6B50B
MLARTKPFSIAIAVMLGIGVNVYLAIPAFSASPPSQVAPQSRSASPLHDGDLVRVRSGGPLMTVTAVQGDQVNCSWTDGNGDLKSESFPIAVLSLPVTVPPPDDLRQEQEEERAADQYYKKHCPSGSVSFTGKFHCAF